MLDHTCRSRCLKGYYAKDMECYHCPAHCGECNDDGLCTSKSSRGGLKEGVIFEGAEAANKENGKAWRACKKETDQESGL